MFGLFLSFVLFVIIIHIYFYLAVVVVLILCFDRTGCYLWVYSYLYLDFFFCSFVEIKPAKTIYSHFLWLFFLVFYIVVLVYQGWGGLFIMYSIHNNTLSAFLLLRFFNNSTSDPTARITCGLTCSIVCVRMHYYRPAYNASVFTPTDTPPVACVNHGDFTIPA